MKLEFLCCGWLSLILVICFCPLRIIGDDDSSDSSISSASSLISSSTSSSSSRHFLESIGFYYNPEGEEETMETSSKNGDVIIINPGFCTRNERYKQEMAKMEKERKEEKEGGKKTKSGVSPPPPPSPPSPPSPPRLNCLSRENMRIYNETATKTTTTTTRGTDDDEVDDLIIPSFDLDDPVAVRVLNGSSFLGLVNAHNVGHINRSSPGDCFLTLFYSSTCPFSTNLAGSSFNALARSFPDVQLFAIDSRGEGGLSTLSHYGVMALPTIFIFHNHRPMYKFNGTTYDLKSFSLFVTQFTGMEPLEEGGGRILEEDYEGPVPTKAEVVHDLYLYLAWAFTILVAVISFGKSSLCHTIYQTILNTWREAEIQRQQHQEDTT